jgi:hypothetical protein
LAAETRVAGRILEEMTMTTNADRRSAKIYDFPKRGRFALPEQAGPETKTEAAEHVFSRAAAVAVGGAWYHDEAVDAERSRTP